MINDVRNSSGFANFATAKKLKARAPYSSKFQPLKAEVEAVRKADMIEPYSVEQSLRAFDEESDDANDVGSESATSQIDDGELDIASANIEPAAQSQLYSGTGGPTSNEGSDSQVNDDDQLDDKAIVDTVVTNISEKIDTSFGELENNIAKSIEMRLGKAMLGVFKQQLADETNRKLRQAITSILHERTDARVNISGPSELIELFKSHPSDESEETKMSFLVDETSADLIVQIEEIAITSRFDELDNLVSELFE
ncbi:MAG: hypothetical protein AAGF25_01200 [Pseudomonadota bacterium]